MSGGLESNQVFSIGHKLYLLIACLNAARSNVVWETTVFPVKRCFNSG